MKDDFEDDLLRITNSLRDPGATISINPNITSAKAADLILQLRACLFRVIDEVAAHESDYDLVDLCEEISSDILSVSKIDVF